MNNETIYFTLFFSIIFVLLLLLFKKVKSRMNNINIIRLNNDGYLPLSDGVFLENEFLQEERIPRGKVSKIFNKENVYISILKYIGIHSYEKKIILISVSKPSNFKINNAYLQINSNGDIKTYPSLYTVSDKYSNIKSYIRELVIEHDIFISSNYITIINSSDYDYTSDYILKSLPDKLIKLVNYINNQ